MRFTATDDDAGVASTQYELDGATTWTTLVGGKLTIGTDGDHTIQYRSTDTAGNVETTNTCEVKINATAPSVSVAVPADQQVYMAGGSDTIAWTTTPSISGTAAEQATIDGSAVGKGAVLTSGLSLGSTLQPDRHRQRRQPGDGLVHLRGREPRYHSADDH